MASQKGKLNSIQLISESVDSSAQAYNEIHGHSTGTSILAGLSAGGSAGVSSGVAASLVFGVGAASGVGLAVGGIAFLSSIYASRKKRAAARRAKAKLRRQWEKGLKQYKTQLKRGQQAVTKDIKGISEDLTKSLSLSEQASREEQLYNQLENRMGSGIDSLTQQRAVKASKKKDLATALSTEDRFLEKMDLLSDVHSLLGDEISAEREVFDEFKTDVTDQIQTKLDRIEEIE